MNRRLFVGTLMGGIMGSLLYKTLNGDSLGSPATRMPTLFVGHGSPMNAIEKNSYTDFLSGFSIELPKPRAILCISAHWETLGTKVLKANPPKTIHDFYGFPTELYQIQYPAAGAPEVANRIVDLTRDHQVIADTEWGLDHGTWTVLKYLYPRADIPVLQLSLNRNLTLAQHLDLARELKPLRDEGVLIIGSGNITHNLRRVDWRGDGAPMDWAVEFDEMIKKALTERNNTLLLGQESKLHSLWSVAHPSLEHYLPLLYAYGASDEKEQAKFVFEGIQLGSLSMRSVQFG